MDAEEFKIKGLNYSVFSGVGESISYVSGNLRNVQKKFCQALRDQQIGPWLGKKAHPKLFQGTHKCDV